MKLRRFLLILILLTAAFFLTPFATLAQSTVVASQDQEVLSPSWGGMVTFMFDDGNKNIYENALPIFQKYGLVGTLAPIVGAIENQEDWIVTWPQLQEFKKAGWEIGSHTMTHANLTDLSDADLDYELGNSKKLLAKHGIAAKTLVFPYNNYDARVLDYTSRYYENSRGRAGEEINGITCDRYEILCREVSATTRPDEVISWIKEAVEKQMWLVLMLHEIVPGTPQDYQYNAGDLEKIVAFVVDNKTPAPTIKQAMAMRGDALGPNLIKNPNLENLDKSGWAKNWTRNDVNQVVVEPVIVKRVFPGKNHLRITGSSHQNMANPATIKLKDNKRPYLLSFFAEVATEGENGGVGICIDEFDANGNWLNYQWLGGFYWYTCGMPAYLYQPSSPSVAQVIIYISSDPNAKVNFGGDNFFFGIVK
jgi:peptidoglycan/xylan/chitin deacetylase (PgdA/CDA1 family)